MFLSDDVFVCCIALFYFYDKLKTNCRNEEKVATKDCYCGMCLAVIVLLKGIRGPVLIIDKGQGGENLTIIFYIHQKPFVHKGLD